MHKSFRPFGGTLLVVFTLMATPIMAQDNPPAAAAESTETSIGYILGFSVGQQMAQQGFKNGDFDVASLSKGVNDALAGGEPSLTNEQLQEVSTKIEGILRTRQEAQAEEAKKAGILNKEKSDLYMKQNAKKEGIQELEGGVQYQVLTAGDGGSPSAADTVKVHYTGRLTSGKVFDSSVERGEPTSFRVGQVIKGWQDALQKMKVGDKWMLYIPPELAYGERGVPGPPGSEPTIGPNEVLVFEVELLEIL
jgi:FKBP-type peptidyl-prolyl cis-trans isomerase FklB